MIVLLSSRYPKKIAFMLLLLFYSFFVLSSLMNPLTAYGYKPPKNLQQSLIGPYSNSGSYQRHSTQVAASVYTSRESAYLLAPSSNRNEQRRDHSSSLTPLNQKETTPPIGGPGQPEMSSFKSVSATNLVNLFTGDFNYNIPLMDVGGYPLNIYYEGGITMEQEASWVGLGWNINPGNINRNVRGIPDDFNGQDTLKQMQTMKPNKTWGLGIGADAELLGIKALIGANLGVAFNNYLGPSLDLALRGNAALKIASIGSSEKGLASAGANIGIDINSRSGASFSGNVSLTANALLQNNKASFGAGLSTSYNSRTGIKSLQIAEQASLSSNETKYAVNKRTGELVAYNAGGHINKSLYSNSISFTRPSYIPSLRMPLTNTAWSGRFQLGLGMYGFAADVEAEVYGQKSEIAAEDTLQKKPMVGYLYYQNAVNHPDYVMDFTRFNDREVTPNTPVISVPQYSYDVFSIQGEGTGGSIRAFRNDLGYVRDNITTSKDKNFSLGGDIDPPGHYGANFNTVKTPSTIGEWNTGNKLRNSIQFRSANATFENVYFRNPGENCVLDSNRFKQVGGTDLVRFVLAGTNNSPTVEAKLQSFNSLLKPNENLIGLDTMPVINQRNKRTQVISFLTADEASYAGLDAFIKSYDNQTFLDNVTDTLIYQAVPRVGSYRKPHHISQINVTENNGKRYVYGIPVYNTLQQDFTFSVDSSYSPFTPPDTINVTDSNRLYQSSSLLKDNSGRDGYVQITTTPPYAHSFLLSGILSPDYVDVTGNGITEDDLGDAVKFNYTRIQLGNDTVRRWRTPLSGDNSANFNGGSRSEVKDDKGIVCYGERESWYLSSVESKTMIALFYTSKKPKDGKGPKSVYGGIDTSDVLVRKLDSIALFNKADLKKNGLGKAKPVKTVHFGYGNELCQNTPDNISDSLGKQGKLTLDSIWFSYNGATRSFKNKYRFSYGNNPPYVFGASDRWGNYKPISLDSGALKNSDYPYTIQDSRQKATIDQNASAWTLNKIILPAGGEINVSYETDDYAWVQNKRAAEMMNIVGFGNSSSYSTATDRLYSINNTSSIENDYVFINVPVACSDAVEVHNRYLQGTNQLAFKIWVLMPKGPEYITCYASYNSCGVVSTNHNIIWVKMNRLAGKSPLSVTTLEYLRQQLPGQAFKGYDVSGEPGLKQVGDMLLGMLASLRDAFTDPINAFRKDGKAMHTDLTKCFVRLNDPDGFKYGGGYRVKSVILKDNWDSMTGQFAASYGQKYDYTTTENFNGTVRRISSGVASYEPAIGGEENPFQSIIQVEDYLPAGPASFGAVEMPVLDAFFPAPLVGYSKVTVTPIKFDTTKKSRSGIGKQVTEFYTAKDFPVYYSYTPFDAASVKEFHQGSTLAFFNKYAYDFKAQSQAFLIATNDMHGKMKSQSSYAENDTTTRISYTENFYKNTGNNGLNDKFSFISKDNKGAVYSGNMGIDVDLMTDTREFSVKSNSLEVQGQVDVFYFGIPFTVPTIWPVSGTAQNIYRAVTTTKVINYHSVLDSVVVIDKGSQVSTKNLAYDAETGEVLVTRTNNEFDKPVYNTSYPAYWAYGGMGLAYKNIDAVYSDITFTDGKITNAGFDFSIFESGDELLIKKAKRHTGCNGQVNDGGTEVVWAFDKNKNITSLVTTPDFIFIDRKGRPYTMDSVTFRIIRSGHRNLLDAKVATVTSMVNPISTGKLRFDTASKVINASATEFKEKWLVDNDVFNRLRSVKDPVTCITTEVPDSVGYLESTINPYRKGLVANFKPYRNMVFYDTRKEYDTSSATNISANGYLNNFKPYWDFNTSGNLVPDALSTQWVWNNKLNKTNAKGMELETMDALGIYTSAQYGYNKTTPVAIANNARYNEMFAEGFEDYGYGESINNTAFNFFNRHINFNGLPNSSVINTDTTNFKAHTGRYVLKVNASSTSSLSIPLLSQADTTSAAVLAYQKDTTGVLSTQGGNYTFTPIIPKSPGGQGTAAFGTGSPSLSLDIQPIDTFFNDNTIRMHYYTQSGYFYISVTTAKTYSFGISMATAYNNNGVTVNTHSNGFGIIIYDSLGGQVSSYFLNQNGFDHTAGNYSAFLCPGTYLVNYSANEIYNASNNGLNYTRNGYSWSCSNSTSPDYKNLTKTNGCIFTRPVAASATMQNPLFSIPANKKMLFTAWVHESCGDPVNGIPCRDSTYTYNQVQLNFGTRNNYNDTLYPSGPIIDGWQKYEGSFTAPPTSTGMTLSLVNTGAAPIYFDDIRIQPFNSNVKSYVYDPVNLRLISELDANNYATFYDYDEQGTLIRTKVETKEGVKTVTETRSFLQRVVH